MASGGISGFETRQLVPAAFCGFRSWQFRELGGQPVGVQSVTYHYDWVPGVNTATCMRRTTAGVLYGAPMCKGLVSIDCGCGFWAFTGSPQQWFGGEGPRHPSGGYAWTCGTVEGYGRVVLGPKGFRCEKAIVTAFVRPRAFVSSWGPTDEETHVFGDDPDMVMQGRHAAARLKAERAYTFLREAFPITPIFESVEEMLTVVELSDTTALLAEPEAS